MTKQDLQDALVEETKIILRDVYTKDSEGNDVGVKVYAQELPEISEDEDDDAKRFPYAIVRVGDSKTDNDDDTWHVVVDWLLGVYDDDLKRQGHRHILIMSERITDRFIAEPTLNKMYRAEPEISTALQDENTHPYYFGGVEMTFSIPKIGRRDDFS